MHFDFAEVFLTILVTVVIAAGLLSWAWIIDQWRRHQPLLPQEPHAAVPWEGIDLIMVLVVWLVLQIVCAQAAVQWTGTKLPPNPADYTPQQQLAMLISQFAASLATFILGFSLIQFRTGATAAELGFDARQAAYDLKIGAIAFSAIAPIIFAIQALLTSVFIPYEHPVKSVVEHRPTVAVLALLGLSTILIAPLVEEFFFRVLLQGWLEKVELWWMSRTRGEFHAPQHPLDSDQAVSATDSNGNGDTADRIRDANPDRASGVFGSRRGFLPVVGSSMLFALMHFGQGPAMVPLFVFAMVLGTLYQRTHRFLPSFTVHLLLNAVSMAMLFAGDPTQP